MNYCIPFVAFVILFIGSLKANASHKPAAGIGFTNNVHYDDDNKKSDSYIWLQNFSYFEKENSEYSAFVKFKNYFNNSEYNTLSLNISRSSDSPRVFKFMDHLNLSTGGTKYLEGNAGITEDSFDNIYFEISLDKEIQLKKNLSLYFEPGTQSRYYLDFDGRFDQSLFGLIDLNGRVNKLGLNGGSRLDVVLSNKSEYRRNSLHLFLGGQYPITQKTKLQARFNYIYTSYPGRDVSTVTVVNRNRNKTVVTSQNENETHRYTDFEVTAVTLVRSLECKSALNVFSQKSKSGYEDYSGVSIEASVAKTF